MKENPVTPICQARWLWIFQADTRHNPEGVYSITLVTENNQAWNDLIKRLETQVKEYADATAKMTKKKVPVAHVPWVTDEKTGERIFTCKAKALGKRKDGTTWDAKPRIVGPDPKIEITEADLDGKLGNGTKVRVGFSPYFWQVDGKGAGLTAQPTLIQIIEPVYYDPLSKFVDYSSEDGKGFTTVTGPQADWFRPKEVRVQTQPTVQNGDFLIQIERLNREKDLASAEKDFEKAARIRDQIDKLKKNEGPFSEFENELMKTKKPAKEGMVVEDIL